MIGRLIGREQRILVLVQRVGLERRQEVVSTNSSLAIDRHGGDGAGGLGPRHDAGHVLRPTSTQARRRRALFSLSHGMTTEVSRPPE